MGAPSSGQQLLVSRIGASGHAPRRVLRSSEGVHHPEHLAKRPLAVLKHDDPRSLATAGAVVLLHPTLALVGVSIGQERGCQQNDSAGMSPRRCDESSCIEQTDSNLQDSWRIVGTLRGLALLLWTRLSARWLWKGRSIFSRATENGPAFCELCVCTNKYTAKCRPSWYLAVRLCGNREARGLGHGMPVVHEGLEIVGGTRFLVLCAMTHPLAVNLPNHPRRILEKSKTRILINRVEMAFQPY